MQYIFGIIIFLIGTALGSFISVIANRYNTGLPFLRGRSVCFSCNTQLSKKDLIPIFSFLFLCGRCRYCQSKIPKEVFMTEILMGILTILAFLKSGLFVSDFSLMLATSYLLLTFIFAIILLISIYDLKHFIIPDSFLIYLFIFSFLYLLISNFFILHNSDFIIQNLISGIILAVPFLLIFLISKGRWLGFGDVKYIAVLGFFLGFAQGLSAVVIAFWIGAVVSLSLLPFKKNLTIKSEIPFGPFLSLGTIISFCLSLDIFKIHELFL